MPLRSPCKAARFESLEPRLLLSSADVLITNPTLSVDRVGPDMTYNNVTINYTIFNNSDTPIVAGGYIVDVYLSYDTTITAADRLIGSKLDFTDVAAHSSNAVVDHTLTLTVPDTVGFWTYYLGYHIRSNGEYSDPNDANNWTAGPQILIDTAGDSLAAARDLGAVSSAAMIHIPDESIGEQIGALTDLIDYYRFTANGTVTICAELHSYNPASVYGMSILDSTGLPIITTNSDHLGQMAVTPTLTAGTYYVRMFCTDQRRTNYELWLGGPAPTNVSMASVSVPPGQALLKPGMTIDVNRTFNVANAVAKQFSIYYYLSTDGTKFAEFLGQEIVDAGAAVGAHAGSFSVPIPLSFAGGSYYISAAIHYWDGPQTLTSDDWFITATPVLTLTPSFTLGSNAGLPTSRTFHDASGDQVTISYTGPGTAEVNLTGGVIDDADIAGINIWDSTLKSALTITPKGKGATSTVGPIAVHGSIKSIASKNVDLASTEDVWAQLAIDGTATNIRFRDMISSEINIGAGAAPGVTIAIRFGTDGWIESDTPIKSFTCVNWKTSPNYAGTRIQAPSVGTIKSTGKTADDVFSGALILGTENQQYANVLGRMTVAGDLMPYEWSIWGHVGSITVNGAITSEEARPPNCWIYGSIDNIKAAACHNVFWQVGLRPALEYPDGGFVATDDSDFDHGLLGVIKSIKITGIKGNTDDAFFNSIFSARKIDSVSIVSRDPAGAWWAGVATPQLGKFSYKDGVSRQKFTWPFAAGAPAEVNAMVRVV